MLWDRDQLELTHHTLELPRFSHGGLRIAFLSDWHLNYGTDQRRVLRSIRMAMAERPDVFFLGGDYMTVAYEFRIAFFRRCLEHVRDTGVPAFAVWGNHDFFAGTLPRLRAEFERVNIPVMTNERRTWQGIDIWGIDDALEGQPDYNVSPGSLVLLHEPDFTPRVTPTASLVVSGHTHGGQVCLPNGRPIQLPDGGENYVRGRYDVGDVPLYVTRGIGMTGIPLRAYARPEVTILDLR